MGRPRGQLDAIQIPEQPLDILAQQIVASVACEDWNEDELFELFRRAWPYRNLSREDFDAIIELTSEGVAPKLRRGAHLHRDHINGRVRAALGPAGGHHFRRSDSRHGVVSRGRRARRNVCRHG